MKTLQQIREETKNITETDDKKLTNLIRAGLFDMKRLPLLKRALSKDNTKLSPQERNSLIELLDTLIAHVTGDQTLYTKLRGNLMHEAFEVAGDLPQVLILKRKSIRVFPDGQRVALYWADKLGTYVSVPYSSVGVGYSTAVSEEKMDNLAELNNIMENKEIKTLTFLDETEMEVSPELAENILDVFNQLDENNQSMVKFLIEESSVNLQEILEFGKE